MWYDDEWFNESDGKIYVANFFADGWYHEDGIIHFPPKTVNMSLRKHKPVPFTCNKIRLTKI